MASPTQNASPTFWQTTGPYLAPPLAASLAIIPVFRGMIRKSALQKGELLPQLSMFEGMKKGVQAAPTIGVIIGIQMLAQERIQQFLVRDPKAPIGLTEKVASSAAVGVFSSIPLAIFNGQTMGWSLCKSIRRLSIKQIGALSLQEGCFVLGISAAEPLSKKLKETFGDKYPFLVESIATMMGGAAGALGGHPGNTALTRWQSRMTLTTASQTMWGLLPRASAVARFALLYKIGTDLIKPSETPPTKPSP